MNEQRKVPATYARNAFGEATSETTAGVLSRGASFDAAGNVTLFRTAR